MKHGPREPPSDPAGDRTRLTRLSRLGVRTAEVAHELRLPLSLIIGSLENLESQVALLTGRVRALGDPADPDIGNAVANAETLIRVCLEGARRLEGLTEQLAGYARGSDGGLEPGRVDLGRLLRITVDLVARATSHPPAVTLDIPLLPAVRADEKALAGVFVNLFHNAFDALVQVADPVLRVSAGTVPGCLGLPPAVEVVVADNGPAIAATDRDRVFEPFFTRNPHAGGLGLGLALARELVEAQGGTVTLEEHAELGTAFCVRLPVAL
ncbi:MAG: HAMP domain-containing sensor histidine kinase [Candidatus Binatia bacterium]